MTTTATAPTARTHRPASRRGVLVYAVGVLVLATIGGLVMASSEDPGTSAGALLFVLSPLLLAVGLRTIGREGWADAGLRLGRERGWYAVALLLFPVLFAAPIALGALTGDVHVAPGAGPRFAALLATGFLARLTFAAFEELGWRGYLEPRLAALGVPALRRHLAVGVLWAVWHVPYIVAFGDGYTDLPLAAQLPLFTVAVLAMAVIWGVARDRTGSVWPAVLGHGMANAVAFPLLATDVLVIDSPLVHSARPEGLVVLPLLVLTAVVVFRRWGSTVRA
ncbi:type II CAAX prenyl endopeptidase Rce1 family protein [Cellulomonas sp.]|uniref:CPBP family glutamic-type intramembrane protease n=1 Tax=Cellulomonas sp. TaxID=40001 RepID=UPI003BA85110